MKVEDKLKSKFGQDPGFKVPDGYFDEIFTKISDSLPERKIEKPKPLTMWQRVRPYVYLAAMFAGIWCMMKMFHMMTAMPDVSLDNPPQIVAEAMAHPENADELASIENVNDYELVSELAQKYSDFEEFEADFDYELEEEYADIDLSELEDVLDAESPITTYADTEEYVDNI